MKQLLEAILFHLGRPVKKRELEKLLSTSREELEGAIGELRRTFREGSGIRLQELDDALELVTAPEASEVLASLTGKAEEAPLTRPQLETLTIIAYRGPIGKAEIETIRGVNSSLILRNLLIRGLIDEDDTDLEPRYRLTSDTLKYLGLTRVEELPDYETLHSYAKIDKMLEDMAS